MFAITQWYTLINLQLKKKNQNEIPNLVMYYNEQALHSDTFG